MGRVRVYHGDIFPVRLVVAEGFDDSMQLRTALIRRRMIDSDYRLDDRSPCSLASCYLGYDDGADAIIALWSEPSVPLIAHEATHAAVHYCEGLGIEISPYSDEPLAYLVQWVCQMAIDGCGQCNK